MNKIQLWGYPLEFSWLTQSDIDYLNTLPSSLPTVEWVWEEIDRVWDIFFLDNKKPLINQPVVDFYSHPVWLMNGIFTMIDPVSVDHREAISKYISQHNAKNIADYGGGFGSLAIQITQLMTDASVTIIEPYPSKVTIETIRDKEYISLVSELASSNYDMVIAQDILEHVEEPVLVAFKIANSVKVGGKIIFANCFYPVISCHLPTTFHLRHTFKSVMKSMGLHYAGNIKGAAHAQVFEKVGDINLQAAQRTELYSKLLGSVVNSLSIILTYIKKIIKK